MPSRESTAKIFQLALCEYVYFRVQPFSSHILFYCRADLQVTVLMMVSFAWLSEFIIVISGSRDKGMVTKFRSAMTLSMENYGLKIEIKK